MAVIIVHVLLLVIESPNGGHTSILSGCQCPPQSNFFVNRGKAAFQIAQLLSNCFTGLFCTLLAAAAELEKIFVGLLAIGTGFPAICRIMKDIQKLFRFFTSLIQMCIRDSVMPA